MLTLDFGAQGCHNPGSRDVVSNRADRSSQQSTLQAGYALATRLQSLTPPVDEDEKNEESRRLEAHARKELEEAGCPPCYPPDLDITTRNVLEKLRAIVNYWLASLRADDVALCAQASDYRKFLVDQLHTRRRLGRESFGKFEDEVRERRRRYGLRDDVHLLLDLRQHSRLQNWLDLRTSACGGRGRGPKASSPSTGFSPAKVMKAQPRKRKTRIRKPRQPKVDATIQDLDATSKAAPIRQETMPRLTKEDDTLLRPLRPQRVHNATAQGVLDLRTEHYESAGRPHGDHSLPLNQSRHGVDG
ncbi:MAG: hypothetical protein M1817_001381 [Caeruleum heppii]|nr:MAG: hypothetical protein M1817_001381 [Caeruleum heppii]